MKKLLVFYYFFVIFYFFFNNHAFAGSNVFTSSASSIVVTENTTGTVLFQKNINYKIYNNSLPELISLYVIFSELKNQNITLNTRIKIIKNTEIYKIIPYGNAKVESLIKAITVLHSKGATLLLAQNIYSSEEKFINAVNKYAKQLGLYNANFINLNQFSDIHNSSTAKDIANLSRRIIIDFPEYTYFFNLNSVIFNGIQYRNKNLMLSNKNVNVNILNYYNNNDNYGLVFSATNAQGLQFTGVISGLKSFSKLIKETKRIINYISSNTIIKSLYKKGSLIKRLPVINGSKHSVNLYASSDINIFYNKNINNLNNYQAIFVHNDVLFPNINKGDIVGNIIIQDKSNPSSSYAYNIVSNVDIKEGSLISKIFAYPYYTIQKLINKITTL